MLKGLSELILSDYYSKMEAIDNTRYRNLKEKGKIKDKGSFEEPEIDNTEDMDDILNKMYKESIKTLRKSLS